MEVSFEHLWPLALLVGLVPLWWARRTSLIEFHPRQLTLMLGLRTAAFVLVVLAMMQPVLHRGGSWLSVAYLLDVSRSVDPRAVEEGIAWIEQARGAGDAEESRFLAFGGNAVLVDSPEALRSVRVADGPARGVVDRSESDLSAALERAVASLPPYHVPRVVLLSDGRATRGNLDDTLRRMEVDGIGLYARTLGARREADAWIDDVQIGDDATAGLPFPVTVRVQSQAAGTAELVIRSGADELVREEIGLAAAGSTRVLLPVIEDAGPTTLEIELLVPGDPVADNNTVQVAVQARERASVLYVEGRPETASYLGDALDAGGFDVTVRLPWEMPTRVADLARFDLVVLSDVLPQMVSAESMRAVATYVQELGGGFLFAGGESVFGEEGYSDTALEQVVPIWFKAEREPRDLALVIALDKSYSMVGDKMALAKEASKAALRLLEDDQQFGLLAFDYHFYWPVPIQLATGKARIEERISSIEASSPTNIYPALQDVYQSLLTTEAEIKHVILLSDGKTYEDDYEGLVTKMAEAEITVSTVAVGDKADDVLLANIAIWGKGRSYVITDPSRVPEVFIDETQMAQGITLEESDEVSPVIRKPVEALAGLDLEALPPLLGYVRTMAKDHAEIVMETEDGDPILARWQYGLGRAAFFAADVKNRWSANWLEWDGYGKFWVQLARELMRQESFREPRFHVVRTADTTRVSLEATDALGRFRNALRPRVEVIRAGAEPVQVQLPQVAPGSYMTQLHLPMDEDVSLRWTGDDGAIFERRLFARVSDELKFRPADEALLADMAGRTGGIFNPSARQAASRGGLSVVRPTRLWPGLAALALALYLANMLLRRVRVIRDATAS